MSLKMVIDRSRRVGSCSWLWLLECTTHTIDSAGFPG
jgi:hypothetical protein